MGDLFAVVNSEHTVLSKRGFIVDMSGTDRKRSSKWDLGDELEFSPGSKQMRPGWSSADVAGRNSSKRAYSQGNDKLRPVMGFSSKEFSGGRGSNKDGDLNKDHRVVDTRREWDTDGNYSKKMSPWPEERKQQRHSQSPNNGWSRLVLSEFLNIDENYIFLVFY